MRVKHHKWLKLWIDRLLSKGLLRQFAALGVLLFVIFLISWGCINLSDCEWKQFAKDSNIPQFLLPLYLLIDTNAFNNLYINGVHGWALIVSSITFVFGVVIFNGAIISIITNYIEYRVRSHKEGRRHYLKSGHYIIMGYDDMVPSFISHIFEKDKNAYILILTAKDTTSIRELLLKSFSKKQMKHVIINYGHRVSSESYKDICLENAEELFIVGNHSNAAHDAINVECVESICHYLKGQKKRPAQITCVFKDLDTYAAFKTSEIFKIVRDLDIEFIPYNFYSGWAKQVFVKRVYKDFDNPGTEYKYPLVYGKGIKPDDDKYVHLVFVGTTNFAVAFAMEAAHVLHFPNFAQKGVRTRITFIDVNADKEKDEFITRNRHFFEVQPYIYRDLSGGKDREEEGRRIEHLYRKNGENVDFLDVEFEFIKGDVFSKQVQDLLSCWATEHKEDNQKQCLSIFLALADQRQNFVMGMNMPDEVYSYEVPIFIRQDRSDTFVTKLRKSDRRKPNEMLTYSVVKDGKLVPKEREAKYANIYPFGMNETAFSADDHSLKRAKLINYLYEKANFSTHKFQSFSTLDAIPEKEIWKEANDLWKKRTVAKQWSNLYNSYTIRTKLRTLRAMRGLDIDDESHDYDTLSSYEVEQLARVEHNRWNLEKLLMGYRAPRKEEDKYEHPEFAGDLHKNKDLFIHNDIRPFDQLDDIRELDYEFARYIPWIMKMTCS